jgi:hypothetical protein
MSLGRPGSLAALLDEVGQLHGNVAAAVEDEGLPRPRVYRWRPLGNIELPAIYNWMDPSPAEWRDAAGHRHRDTISIVTMCAVRRTDSDEFMGRLEVFADCYREVVDAAYRSGQPLNNAAKWADRPMMQMADDEFDNAPVLAVKFTSIFHLDRSVTPTT